MAVSGGRKVSNSFRLKSCYNLFINGKECRSIKEQTFSLSHPATAVPFTQVAAADAQDVEYAISSAKQAFERGSWSKADIRHRAFVLNTIAQRLREKLDEFAFVESYQTGRALREMQAQLKRLPEWFEYYAAIIRTHEGTVPPFSGEYLNYVERIPLGVVAQITPWNHPLLIAIKKLAPALAAGNSIVLKPSDLAPICVIELTKLMHEAGLPDGVVNCVPGDGAIAGQALTSSKDINKIDFTGGTTTGRIIGKAAGGNGVGMIAELGGKTPMIVFPDADLDQTINGLTFGAFVASGQTCITGSRLLVHESVYDKVIARFIEKTQSIKLGDPMELSTQMGPVISQPQLTRIHEMVKTAVKEGGQVLTGGKAPSPISSRLKAGYYYEPTIITNVTPDMSIFQDEVFGPVVVVTTFQDEAEAISLANNSPFGLAASIWSRDIHQAHRVAKELQVGIVWVNDHHRNDPSSPWGGLKASGIGRENGLEAFLEYSQAKSVVVNYSRQSFDWFGGSSSSACARYS